MATTTFETRQTQKDKKRSRTITTVIHVALLALFIFPFMNNLPEKPQLTDAIVVDFRDFKSASAKSSTKRSTEASGKTKPVKVSTPKQKVDKKPTPKPVPTAKKKPVLTNEKEKEVIPTKPIKAEKPVEAPIEKPTEVKPELPKEKVKPIETPSPVLETPEVEEEAPATPEGSGTDASGSTTGEGEGNSGSSNSGNSNTDGLADEGENGMDMSGDGIFNRRVIKRADVKKITNETGKIVINLCISPSGKVNFAEYNEEESTIDTPSVIKKAEKVARNYRFERDYTAPKKQCGKLSFLFDIEEE